MSTELKMFPSLPSSYLLSQSMGRLFGSCIEEAARLSGMKTSEWMAIEEGAVPQDASRLRAMADAMQISFDQIGNLVLLCQAAWEL